MKSTVMIIVAGDLYGRMLARQFQAEGFGVCAILDRGEEAVERARLARPDMILLDFLLEGDLDGIETAKMIQGATLADIVFLHNRVDSGWMSRAAEVRARAVVSKQESPASIVSAVRAACS